MNLKGKKVLVTGGTGLIGQQLIKLLKEEGANIRIVSLDNNSLVPPDTEFMQLDLMNFDNCKKAC